jgi:hypothetical protein
MRCASMALCFARSLRLRNASCSWREAHRVARILRMVRISWCFILVCVLSMLVVRVLVVAFEPQLEGCGAGGETLKLSVLGEFIERGGILLGPVTPTLLSSGEDVPVVDPRDGEDSSLSGSTHEGPPLEVSLWVVPVHLGNPRLPELRFVVGFCLNCNSHIGLCVGVVGVVTWQPSIRPCQKDRVSLTSRSGAVLRPRGWEPADQRDHTARTLHR